MISVKKENAVLEHAIIFASLCSVIYHNLLFYGSRYRSCRQMFPQSCPPHTAQQPGKEVRRDSAEVKFATEQ